MDFETYHRSVMDSIGGVQARIMETENKLSGQIADAMKTVNAHEVKIAVIESGLSRHEEDHDKTEKQSMSVWSKISLGLGILVALLGIGAAIFK